MTTHLASVQRRSQANQQRLYDTELRLSRLTSNLVSFTKKDGNHESEEGKVQRHSVEHLQRQLHQRSQLLRQSAHDLKSSFSIVSTTTSMLLSDQPTGQQQPVLSMLKRNLRQANFLLDQLLDVTRLEAGEEYQQLANFDVGKMLAELVSSVWPVANEKGLWLRTKGVDSLPIEGDPIKLYRIAQNVIVNAIKYTRVGGVMLEWGMEATLDRWFFFVTDTGPGLGNQPPSGEGIGLQIVHQLCTLLEGQYFYTEGAAGGLTYRFSFPAQYIGRFEN